MSKFLNTVLRLKMMLQAQSQHFASKHITISFVEQYIRRVQQKSYSLQQVATLFGVLYPSLKVHPPEERKSFSIANHISQVYTLTRSVTKKLSAVKRSCSTCLGILRVNLQ